VYYCKVEKADEDQEFEVLKDNEVQVLGTVTREMLVELADATKQPTLSVKAYAVQYDEAIETISTAASAWALVQNENSQITP